MLFFFRLTGKVGRRKPASPAVPAGGLVPVGFRDLTGLQNVILSGSVQIFIVRIQTDPGYAGQLAQMLKGQGKLVGILKALNIRNVLGIVGGHGVYQRVGGKYVQHFIQLVQGLLYRGRGAVEGILGGGKSLLPGYAADAEIGVQRKQPQRQHHQKKKDPQQLGFQLAVLRGEPM